MVARKVDLPFVRRQDLLPRRHHHHPLPLLPIWPNFLLWQKIKSLANFCRVYITLAKILKLFGHIFMLLGKFWLLQMAKYWKLSIAIWSHSRWPGRQWLDHIDRPNVTCDNESKSFTVETTFYCLAIKCLEGDGCLLLKIILESAKKQQKKKALFVSKWVSGPLSKQNIMINIIKYVFNKNWTSSRK